MGTGEVKGGINVKLRGKGWHFPARSYRGVWWVYGAPIHPIIWRLHRMWRSIPGLPRNGPQTHTPFRVRFCCRYTRPAEKYSVQAWSSNPPRRFRRLPVCLSTSTKAERLLPRFQHPIVGGALSKGGIVSPQVPATYIYKIRRSTS